MNFSFRVSQYSSESKRGMKWFNIYKVLLIIQLVFGTVSIIGQGGSLIENIPHKFGTEEFALAILPFILQTIPGLIIKIITIFGFYNLLYYAFTFIVIDLFSVNTIITCILLAVQPGYNIDNLLPIILPYIIVLLAWGLPNIIYFYHRKDIFCEKHSPVNNSDKETSKLTFYDIYISWIFALRLICYSAVAFLSELTGILALLPCIIILILANLEIRKRTPLGYKMVFIDQITFPLFMGVAAAIDWQRIKDLYSSPDEVFEHSWNPVIFTIYISLCLSIPVLIYFVKRKKLFNAVKEENIKELKW